MFDITKVAQLIMGVQPYSLLKYEECGNTTTRGKQ